jgi:hypothetical protein
MIVGKKNFYNNWSNKCDLASYLEQRDDLFSHRDDNQDPCVVVCDQMRKLRPFSEDK